MKALASGVLSDRGRVSVLSARLLAELARLARRLLPSLEGGPDGACSLPSSSSASPSSHTLASGSGSGAGAGAGASALLTQALYSVLALSSPAMLASVRALANAPTADLRPPSAPFASLAANNRLYLCATPYCRIQFNRFCKKF